VSGMYICKGLTALTSEIGYDQEVMGLPADTSTVSLIAKSFLWIIIMWVRVREMLLLPFQG
jgi:hypothetical protein